MLFTPCHPETFQIFLYSNETLLKKIVNNKNSFIIIIDFRYLLKYWKSPYMGEWKTIINNNTINQKYILIKLIKLICRIWNDQEQRMGATDVWRPV